MKALEKVTKKPVKRKRKWTPTANQQKFLTLAAESDATTIKELCEMTGVTRQVWYQWKKNPHFARWFKDEWDKNLAFNTMALDKKGLRFALMGDFKFWEAMQKRVGNLSDNKGQNLTQINIQLPDWYRE